MKTRTTHTVLNLLLIFTIGLAFASCDKDRIEEEPTVTKNEYSDVNAYFDQKKQEEQEFVITNEDGTDPIIGKEGTKIWISKNCLEFQGGGAVDFPYTVKLIELYTPSDMIYYQMPTVAAGNILETGGEIRVRAFKDDSELTLKANCSFAVEMKNDDPKNYMEKFYGYDFQVTDSKTIVDWTDDISSFNISDSTSANFNANQYGYYAQIARLGWLNCDVFRNNGSGHTLTFKSTTDALTQVAIFIYFPDLFGVMQAYGEESDLIPSGSNVSIICIGNQASGALFSFKQDLTVTSDADVNIVLTPTTDAVLTAMLDAL